MNGLKDWWNQNSPRDQLALFSLAIVFVIYLIYALVTGVHGKYIEQLDKNERAKSSLNQVRELSAELLARDGGDVTKSQENITEQVNNSLREFNLNLSSMQPQSNGAVRLRMEQVRYSSLVSWMHEIEVNQGVKIKDSTVTTGSEKGKVSVTVTLLK